MKNTGIIRRIDELGRIVIPKKIRTKLNINIGDSMGNYIDGHSIILEKEENSCMFCSKTKNLKSFNDKLLCDNCISKISKLIEN